MGKKARLKPRNMTQKLNLPSLSFSMRPVIFRPPVIDGREIPEIHVAPTISREYERPRR